MAILPGKRDSILHGSNVLIDYIGREMYVLEHLSVYYEGLDMRHLKCTPELLLFNNMVFNKNVTDSKNIQTENKKSITLKLYSFHKTNRNFLLVGLFVGGGGGIFLPVG